ncbi:aminofutalosine synthase MqnE [Malaciobacter marinus]|uniref:aminofutalosine synthase MqnE n=1 Tax=Malaciobacter marinus TaxID=505249 RepID=UPI003B004EB7
MNILKKLENTEKLTNEEAMSLYNFDLPFLAKFANTIREKKHGKKTYFNINRHINPTNICKDICQFCAYSVSRKNPNPYTMSHEQILDIIEKSAKNNIKEVYIVSAHNPKTGLEWYLGIFKKIKEKFPNIHIKVLTAAEIHFLSQEYNISYEKLIEKIIESGVDSLPGGGAEIFNEQIRKMICGGKVSSDEWIEIHKLWHKSDHKSTASILFGHIETKEHRIEHMIRLRDLQEETNGFNAFIPLLYQRENNYLKVKKLLSEEEFLKTIAIARILLFNIPNIKAYWVTSTMKFALEAQKYGANDLDGMIEKESIQSAAGAKSKNSIHLNSLVDSIKESGFIPVERDSIYNEIKTW